MSQPTISILLIEDNANDVELMSAMLAHGAPSAGNSESPYFQLMHVAALNAGLSRLAETNFDIILTDLSLPDSHGLDTFRRLRQAAPELPLIVLTSNSDTALAIQAVREGAQDYLDKNRLDNYSLTRALDYALERKRAEAAQRESELFSLSILNSLTAHIAVIDTDGIILVVNEAWERFARENGDPALAHTGPGVNYLAVCRRAVDSADSLAAQALAGLESVLSKSQT
ncbi:MAG TPA: response regulator, partial [Anaerolineales bacterium]|nr:response regulator [Anaerolineales bacterium]